MYSFDRNQLSTMKLILHQTIVLFSCTD
jgi:hypothetical protein